MSGQGQGHRLSGNDADIERMLREALRVLCSSTVAYTSQLSIDAIVGITVDNAEIIFVKIHEKIESDMPIDVRSSSLEKSSSCDNDLVADIKDVIVHNQLGSRQTTDESSSSLCMCNIQCLY